LVCMLANVTVLPAGRAFLPARASSNGKESSAHQDGRCTPGAADRQLKPATETCN
jgi:hypothetical protein